MFTKIHPFKGLAQPDRSWYGAQQIGPRNNNEKPIHAAKIHKTRHSAILSYTYDYIPAELENGLLFQGIHRPVQGTSILVELFRPATIYFFFQNTWDGGYPEIFSNLKEWEKCTDTPQYDIHNGDHGLDMTMYKTKAKRGSYQIPATTRENACFNIVFQFK
jgi:hypothetical protein